MAASQSLLNVAEPSGPELFILISVLVSVALVPISLAVVTAPQLSAPKRVKVLTLYRVSPLGVVGIVGSGVASGALLGMGAVAAGLLGLSVAQISVFMSAVLFGSIALQWPIGWLSDRFDRRLVMTGVAFATVLAAVLTALAPTGIMLYALVALLGALAVPMYSLSLAHTNDTWNKTRWSTGQRHYGNAERHRRQSRAAGGGLGNENRRAAAGCSGWWRQFTPPSACSPCTV